MATLNLQQMQWTRREGGGVPKCVGGIGAPEDLVEAAGQTYGQYALVYEDPTTGKITAVGSGNVTAAFLGQARKAASGTVDTLVPAIAITEDDVWTMNAYHTTAALALLTKADEGKRFGIKVVNGRVHLDVELPEASIETASTVNAWVKIVGFPNTTNPTDVYRLALVKFGRRGFATDGSPQVDFLQNP